MLEEHRVELVATEIEKKHVFEYCSIEKSPLILTKLTFGQSRLRSEALQRMARFNFLTSY